jgi:DNA-binding NarL/FixJ family response regulator
MTKHNSGRGNTPGKKDAQPLRILIADDHALVRKGLRQVLLDELGPVEFGEASNAKQVYELLASNPWDIILLDLSMPGGAGGLDILKQVKISVPTARVLVLSMHPEDQYAERVLRAGASGYLTKNAASECVGIAIRKVLAGGTYVSTEFAETLAEKLSAPQASASHQLLSDREYQVLRLIGAGKSVKEISHELSLSVKTVSTYRSRLLQKLRLQTSADIIRYALREGLVE